MAADVVKVLNGGLAIITHLVSGIGGTIPDDIGWGIGTTPAAVANTGLETASAEDRAAGTASRQTTTATNDTYRVVGTITCVTASKAITEMVVFDAATAGNAFVRATFDVINVGVGSSIEFTVNTVFSDGSA
jgi:hypothetical protein